MKLFEDLTIRQVKKEILYWEHDNDDPKSVIVICIGQSPDEDERAGKIGDTFVEKFYANVLIDGEPYSKCYVWDGEDIVESWDRDEEDDDDGELPANVVERCEYVGLTMDSADLTNCNEDMDVTAKLKVPVKLVRWNYPFEVKEGSYNVYPIEEAHTWGELLEGIVRVFQQEYAKHESEMSHALGDYIIEPLEIHPNGLATVQFGS